ncbi:hypothetical protein AM571_PC01576 (plasmid) [Rhizobium etli 8C-3]|uniref:Uncharacterized protein n=1 Tax=Rhizobium etli 8C-3 TaxID=538025 RepID=A0A1L5PGD2_RHIET|nr:hypothetical protein AM571_PC01576 [Rhizobium etli 8C-3]
MTDGFCASSVFQAVRTAWSTGADRVVRPEHRKMPATHKQTLPVAAIEPITVLQ